MSSNVPPSSLSATPSSYFKTTNIKWLINFDRVKQQWLLILRYTVWFWHISLDYTWNLYTRYIVRIKLQAINIAQFIHKCSFRVKHRITMLEHRALFSKWHIIARHSVGISENVKTVQRLQRNWLYQLMDKS